MKILIVEDDDYKAGQIIDFLNSNYSKKAITHKKSYQSGTEEILKHSFDLILLDMSMPTFDRSINNGILSSFRHYAGRDILDEMDRRGIFVKAIVVTQFGVFGEGDEEIDAAHLNVMLKDDFPETYLGMVYFNTSFSNWKLELEKLLNKVISEEMEN